MTKAKREMEQDLKLLDLIIELLDARAPLSSLNPDIGKMTRGRGRLIILNKTDLADEEATKKWLKIFRDKGLIAIALDARTRKDFRPIKDAVNEACKEKLERNRAKGIINRPLRAMVAGIPNVGKSTFINTFMRKSAAKTGNKPGVTRGKQWIRLSKELELLDTPGILVPKIRDEVTGFHLAALGTLNDNNLNLEELSLRLVSSIKGYGSANLSSFGINKDTPDEEILFTAAKARNILKKQGEPDTERASALILNEFRSGKLGRITLDDPDRADLEVI